MTAPTAAPDLGRLLGLTGPGAWALAALYAVTFTTLAVTSGGAPFAAPEGKVVLVLLLAAAALLVLPGRTPLPLPQVLVVLAVVVTATVATVWRLRVGEWPGWGSWQFSAISFLMFGLALRGRVVAGAVGLVLMTSIAMHWSWAAGGDPAFGFQLTYWQLATYAAGAFFAVWLRRTARKIAEFQETEARRVAAEVAREASETERREQLERVLRLAGDSLAAIAAGDVDPERRREHALLETELRDGIRGRTLATGALPPALRAARTRGVEVALLDDLRDPTLSPAFVAAAGVWAAERLDALESGDATLRLALLDGAPVVTFSAGDAAPTAFRGPDQPTR